MMPRALFALLLSATVAGAAETYLVAVGVEKYDDAGIAPLQFADADAKALADAFRAAGVPPANVTLLTSNAPDRLRLPTRANVLRALQRVREKAVADDALIFMFSGHGMQQGDEAYLLTVDSNRQLLHDTAVPMRLVKEALRGYQARNILFIVDACRNDPDAGKASADAALDERFAKDVHLRGLGTAGGPEPNAALLLACEVGQRAWEMPDEGHGAFTYYLLKGLAGEAKGEDGAVRLSDLAGYLLREVPAWAKRARREQTPRYENPTGGDFILLQMPDRPATRPPIGPVAPRVEIQRYEATLEIKTNLPRVSVEVDGQPVGITSRDAPLRHRRLLGTVTVRGSAPGHAPVEKTVKLERPDQILTVDLDLKTLPSLTVRTDLPEAEVTFDGGPAGRARKELPVVLRDLVPGTHTVVVSAPGRHPESKTFDLRPGQHESVTLNPRPLPTLTIEVEDDSVAVTLDGEPVGTLGPGTPAMVRNLTVGEHVIEATRDGRVARRTVRLEPDERKRVKAWPRGGPDERPANWPEYLKDFQPPPGMRWSSYRVSPKDGMPQVLIAAGEFLMGSPDTDEDAMDVEKPQKRVYVSAFWMDLHEVTVGQYRRFCDATGRRMSRINTDDRHPVVDVDWADAWAYASWAGRQLPTESQWERAARAGTTTPYPWGDAWDASRANGWVGGPRKATAVGSYPPNAYGLYDMIGNVSEWCRDCYAADWYRRMPTQDPVNKEQSDVRVLRGGSWNSSPGALRAAFRYGHSADGSSANFGFRCVAPAN